MYSDQTGKFPYVANSGKQYLMIVYVVNDDLIMTDRFKTKTKSQITANF